MPLIHSCLIPTDEDEEAMEICAARALRQIIQDLKQRGEWDRGPEHDS